MRTAVDIVVAVMVLVVSIGAVLRIIPFLVEMFQLGYLLIGGLLCMFVFLVWRLDAAAQDSGWIVHHGDSNPYNLDR